MKNLSLIPRSRKEWYIAVAYIVIMAINVEVAFVAEAEWMYQHSDIFGVVMAAISGLFAIVASAIGVLWVVRVSAAMIEEMRDAN